MATYFAQLDSDNKVINVIVADQAFVDSQSGTWVQTDINGASPKNYAGIGYTYSSEHGGFCPPQPFPSWTLNSSTCLYDPPTPMLTDGGPYMWDETSQSWIVRS